MHDNRLKEQTALVGRLARTQGWPMMVDGENVYRDPTSWSVEEYGARGDHSIGLHRNARTNCTKSEYASTEDAKHHT